MKIEKYEVLVEVMQMVDDVESLLRVIQNVNGKGKKSANCRLKAAETMMEDMEKIRINILKLI